MHVLLMKKQVVRSHVRFELWKAGVKMIELPYGDREQHVSEHDLAEDTEVPVSSVWNLVEVGRSYTAHAVRLVHVRTEMMDVVVFLDMRLPARVAVALGIVVHRNVPRRQASEVAGRL